MMFIKYKLNNLFRISCLAFLAVVLFSVNSQAQYVVGTPSSATGTINDDDTATFTINEVSVGEGDGTVTLTVSVDNAIDATATIDISFADGTAAGSTGGTGADYDNTMKSVTFPAGSTADQTFMVTITDDMIVEADENFTASLAVSSSTDLGTRSIDVNDTGAVTITDNDTAVFTIDDVTVGEASGTADFTVSVDKELDIAVMIDVNLTDGTATGSSGGTGADYDDNTVVVTFPANSTTDQTASVTITDDMIVEATENFTAGLAVNSGTTLAGRTVNTTDTGAGNIEDNDEAVFTINDVTVNEASGTASFTVSPDKAIDIAVGIDVSYTDGTATGGNTDYDSATDMLTFAANSTAAQTATVAITDDMIVEASEGFTAGLGVNAGTTLGGRSVDVSDTGAATITDNDEAVYTIDEVTVAEDGTSATLTVSVDKATDIAVGIDVSYSDGTATGSTGGTGADYDNGTDMVTFPANSTTDQMVTVTITDDMIVEADENFTAGLAVSSGTTLAGRTVDVNDTGAVTITDNDTAVFTIDDVTVGEASGTADFTVSVDKELDIAVMIDVNLTDGTATGSSGGTGADYDDNTVVVTFPANSTTDQTASVTITDDMIVEATENFTAGLAVNSGTNLAGRTVNTTDTGAGNIEDNDEAVFTINDVTVNEASGTASFTVSPDKAIDIAVGIDVSYTDGTATGGNTDYDSATDMLTFAANSTAAQTATVAITDDMIVEASEGFTAGLGVNAGTTLGGRSVDVSDTGAATITDNDEAVFTIDEVTVAEDGTSATLTVSVDKATDIAVGIDVSYSDGTATGSTGGTGADYDNGTDMVTFAANSTADQMVTVAITDDMIVEADENFTADLAVSSGTTLGDRTVNVSDMGAVTITDNDEAIFTIDNVTVVEASGTADFTVSVDKEIDMNVMIDVDFTDGTATGGVSGTTGADYDNTTVTVTFNANTTTSQTATVTIFDDMTPEGDEDYTATLSVNSGVMLNGRDVDVTNMGTGTILDDDCPCDPDCAVFPTAADIGSTLQAVEANTIGDYTHYCAAGSKLLFSVKLNGATIPASAVSLKVTANANFYQRYCGGGFFGGCFVKNPDGAAIYDKQWDVDFSATSGVTFPLRVVNYFTNQDLMDLEAAETAGYTPPTNTSTAVQLWKVNNASLPQFPTPTTIKSSHQTTVKFTTGSASVINWIGVPYNVGNGFGAEFEVNNLTKGSGFGGKIK